MFGIRFADVWYFDQVCFGFLLPLKGISMVALYAVIVVEVIDFVTLEEVEERFVLLVMSFRALKL